MSLAAIMAEHAVKASIGALVAGFFAGALMAFRRGATNAHALEMLQQEVKHRDEIRLMDRENTDSRFKAMSAEIARLDVNMQALSKDISDSRTAIMAKLNEMEGKRR